jgi:hypothetical protein
MAVELFDLTEDTGRDFDFDGYSTNVASVGDTSVPLPFGCFTVDRKYKWKHSNQRFRQILNF